MRSADGQRVDAGPTHVAAGNPKQLVIGVPKLPPGEYQVKWRVTSVDTHKTEGGFKFTVRP